MGNQVEFYNYKRFHETLDYKKPMNVYKESILTKGGEHSFLIKISLALTQKLMLEANQ